MPLPPPTDQVLTAFGLTDVAVRPLSGGQGHAWVAGQTVLKPAHDEVEATWASRVLEDLVEDGFRINRPVRSHDGHWVVDGWSAWSRLDGVHDTSNRWSEVMRAGRALNAALAGLERPAFLDARTNVWSVGDRTAWGEEPLQVLHEAFRPCAEGLAAHVRPSLDPSQIIHGDLTGNVLFARGQPPGVIDFTPYWRPASFCLAIVAVDAVCWNAASPTLFQALPTDDDRESLLARAALYRLITSDRAALTHPTKRRHEYLRENAFAYERVLALLVRGIA